jgi:hypothetical protein
MKQSKILTTIIIAACMVLFLFSCNSGGEKTTTESATDSTAAKTADTAAAKPSEPAAANPGKILVIQHKVANYAKWKPVYESHDSTGRSHGLTNYILGRGMNDSNMVVVMLKMDDVNKAKELTGSQGMKQRMQKAGVVGKPTFNYLDVVMNDDSPIEQNARLMVTHKVKDWDTFKKEFDSHKQVRMDAGLIDRGIAYTDGDNHMVSLVFAVTDKKKADDFVKSKDLKDKMAKAGVEGPPTFFYYNIVQKY